jgi:methionine-rich copper-binding protein CopC
MRWRWITGCLCTAFLVACPQPSDTTPPTITSSSPVSNANDVSISTNLAITFSEAMSQSSVSVSVSPTVNLGTPVWNTPSTVVFDPPDLTPGTSYTVTVDGKDAAGNALGGTKTIGFQTALPPDTTPPTTPAGIRATAGDGEFFVEWNANAEPDLAGYTVYVGAAANALVPTVFIEKPAVLAKVTGLENGKTYFYALDAQDAAGNRSAQSGAASITPKDAVAPTLVSSEPANGATDLGLVPNLRFTFSEPMDTNSLEIGMCVTTDPPASATCPNPSLANFGTPTWSNGDTQAQFTPSSPFQSGKTHVLVVSARDKGGNNLSGNRNVAFSMRAVPDTTPPTVVTHSTGADPATGSGFVELQFSEAMNQQSVQDAFLSQPAISCAWVWTGNNARCNAALKQLTTYTVTLGTNARDSAGNALVAPYQFNFATVNFAPRVIKFSPSGRFGPPINVSVTAPIILTFSEPMDQPLTQAAFEVKVGSTVWPGSLSWNAEGTEMTYQPTSGYGFGRTVVWKITTSARELTSGVPRGIRLGLPAEVSGSFSTRPVIGP